MSQGTLSGNYTSGINADGGAIYATLGAVAVSQSTITLNSAANSAGGGIFSFAAPVTITNSIVAGNASNGAAPDLREGGPLSVKFSLIGTNTGTNLLSSISPDANGNRIGDETGLDPRLAPLADNGGSTKTHTMLADSPALDGGSNAFAVDVTLPGNPALTTDQRGVNRLFNTVDIGAFERNRVLGISVDISGPNLVSEDGTSVTFTYKVTSTSTDDANFPLGLRATLADDNGTPTDRTDDFEPFFVDGDTNGDGRLDPGEVWTYTITQVIALEGGNTLTRTATATGSDDFDIDTIGTDTLTLLGLSNYPRTSSRHCVCTN